MAICTKHHSLYKPLDSLPNESVNMSSKKCPGCAYELGFGAGQAGNNSATLNYNALPTCNESVNTYINPNAAFACGCLMGLAARKNEHY